MAKTLIRDYTKCHGCRECEIACATICEITQGSSLPRITSITWDLEGWGIPLTCQQCQDAPCMDVCPKDAIYRDDELNRVMVDYDRCIGCRMCMAACPFGAMNFDGEARKVIKCDLCDGDPLCAKLCSYGALKYVEESDQCADKRMEFAEKLREIMLGRKGGSQVGFAWR